MQNNVITDSLNPLFQEAFKAYFDELGVSIKDWDGLFQEMKDQPGNVVILKLADTSQQEAVVAAAEQRLQTQRNTFEGYGVEQFDLLTNHYVLQVQGNFVLFAVGEFSGDAVTAFRDAL